MKRGYTPEKAWAELQGELPCYLLYRPLSFYVSLPLLWLRVPIMAVTLSSLALALAMLAAAWRGGPSAPLWVSGLGFAFHVLDCTDGNMARVRGVSSRFGGLVDGTVDMVFWCLLFLSTGLLVDQAGGGLFGDHAVAFSLGLAVLVLLNRQTRDSFALSFSEAAYFEARRPERIPVVDRLLIAVVGLESLYVFAIAGGAQAGVLDRVLAAMGAYVVAIFVGAMVLTFRKAAELDRSA